MTATKRSVSWNVKVAFVWLGSLVVLLLTAAGDGDAYSRSVALARALGWQSSAALVAALSVTPWRRWVAGTAQLRRALGLAAVTSALMHAAITVSTSPLSLSQQLADPPLRFGFGALIVLVLMGVTSFPRLVAKLHLRSWKELHRLVYVAWLCAVLHAFLSPYAWITGVALMTLGVIVVAVVRLLRLQRLLPRRAR